MDIAAIGVGGAGGRIVDRLVRELGTGASAPLDTTHAIDTDTESLDALGAVPRENRHAIGQFETGGDGTDGDRELAAEIVENERTELRRAVEDGIPTTIDAIVVAAGLAGGTASAVTPALVAGLARVYEQPVFTISVLPAGADGRARANTAQALTDLNEAATAQIVFDNDAWLWGSRSLDTHGGRLNGVLVERVGEVLTIGHDGGTAVGQQVIDGQDVLATLSAGGLVTIGYAGRSLAAWRGASSSLLDGLKRSLLGDVTDDFERGVAVQRTLAWATRGTLTFDCPRGAATHGLVAFRGPSEWLRGDAISRGREWFADRAGIERLRSGDVPTGGADSLDVLVVLAGIERTPRIDSFRVDPAESDEQDNGAEGEEPEERESETDPEEWGVAPGETGPDEDSDEDESSHEQAVDDAEAEEEEAADGPEEADSREDTEDGETDAADDPEESTADSEDDDTSNREDEGTGKGSEDGSEATRDADGDETDGERGAETDPEQDVEQSAEAGADESSESS
jgi:cell division GTPase FtsZ